MLQEIVDYICDYWELEPEKINGDSNLIVDCAFGSFDLIELCCQLEQKFHVKISEDEVVQFKTIKDISDNIQSKK